MRDEGESNCMTANGEERAMAEDVDGEREASSDYQRVLTPDEMHLAARVGDLLIASTPGAPRGVIAPGGLPRTPRLVGREALIERILGELGGAGRETAPVIACIGQAHEGKTALAAEIVAQAGERELFPSGAIWLDCESLSGDPGVAHILAQLERYWNATPDPTTPRALLALDHIEPSLDASALLDALAPWNCALLLTARFALQDERAREVMTPPLDVMASGELVRGILRQVDPKRPTEADDEALFDGLTSEASPLALALAAARVALMGLPLEKFSGIATTYALASLNASRLALPEAAQRAWVGLALIDGASFPRGVALAVVGAAIRDNAEATMDESWREEAAETLDALIGLRLVAALAPGRLALLSPARRIASFFSRNGSEEARDIAGAAMAHWWLEYARVHAAPDNASGLTSEAAGLLGAVTWAHVRQRRQLLLDLIATLPAAIRAPEELRLQAWANEANGAP
jgi:hypothetical protein